MKEWKEKTLNELGTVSRGKSRHRPRNASFLYGGLYPFIQTADVKNANFKITEYSQSYSEEGLKQSKLWPKETLCITIAANIADTAILEFEACFPDSIMGFIPFKNISDVRFIKYCFDILQKKIKQISQGTAQDNLSIEKLLTVKFLIPNYSTQYRIASILSAYDDLIENNLKRIKLLEELAQRTYEEWFVKFRVNGEQLEVDEESGMPEGWLKGKVKDLCVLQRGFDLPSQKRQTGCFPIIASTGKIDTHNEFKVKAPGVVTGRSGTIGQVTYVDVDFWPLNTSLWVKEYINCGPCFVYYFLKSLNLEKLKSGVAVPSLDRNVVHAQSCLIPSTHALDLYEQFARPIFYNISNLITQNHRLKESRDILLPRLMSGVINS